MVYVKYKGENIMIFENREYGFHFEMNNNNFIEINDLGKKELFNMTDEQIKQTLFVFVEVIDNKYTDRTFRIVVDLGRCFTPEEIKAGVELNVKNMKEYFPDFKLISESTIMPQNISNFVWKRPDGLLFSQYNISKNGYLFCVSGIISEQHDSLDNMMATVCMTLRTNSKEDLEKESQEKLMFAITEETNRIMSTGVPFNQAVEMAFEKFGIKRN